ncbi:hypothetical protein GMSM_16390 [Geomonas sp. Red276]
MMERDEFAARAGDPGEAGKKHGIELGAYAFGETKEREEMAGGIKVGDHDVQMIHPFDHCKPFGDSQ